MNVDDVSEDKIPEPTFEKDRLALIFERQHELMIEYDKIERKNGFLLPMSPLDIDEKFSQAKLKDFAWRITEELTEATEAYKSHSHVPTHMIEELSDAYHFLIELTMLSGIDHKKLWKLYSTGDGVNIKTTYTCRLECMFKLNQMLAHSEKFLYISVYRVIEELGLAMNCLKNKPWKQTHMLTDILRYNNHIKRAHVQFIHLVSDVGLNANDLYKIYYKKSEVNKFRQRSKY